MINHHTVNCVPKPKAQFILVNKFELRKEVQLNTIIELLEEYQDSAFKKKIIPLIETELDRITGEKVL